MEEAGTLKPVTVGEGQHRINLFDPKTIEALRPAAPPAAATDSAMPPGAADTLDSIAPDVMAACFAMFEQGYLRTETSLKLHVPATVVGRLFAQWEALHTKPRRPPRPRRSREERRAAMDRADAQYLKLQQQDERTYARFTKEIEKAWKRPKRRDE
jgi:hypothetical protein